MTDRLEGVMVTFEKPTRDDDSEATIAAIRQIKGVLAVTPILQTGESGMVGIRIRRELIDRLYEVLK